MSTFILKIIAMVTMLIDHLAKCFLPADTVIYAVCRAIGRVSFPIFCFLLVEGYYYTRSRTKYALRLFAAAVVSEIGYNMAFYKSFAYIAAQNVIWTLLLGFLAIILLDKIKTKFYPQHYGFYMTLSIIVTLFAAVTAFVFRTDYDMYGIILILLIFYLRGHVVQQFMAFSMITFLFAIYNQIGYDELFAALSFVLFYYYNGKKGRDDHRLFYLFYPLHLVVIGIFVMQLI